MPLEFIASLASASPSASGLPSPGESPDPDYPARVAALHEESGFDRVLIGHSPEPFDGFVAANQVLTTTSRVGVLLGHQPGIAAPTIAARQYATLEAFHPGRVALHVLAGRGDGDRRRDSAACDSALQGRRAEEFLAVVKLAWGSRAAFDYAGEFYRVAGGWSDVRPASGSLPIYIDAACAGAVRAGAAHADVVGLDGKPVAAIAWRIAAVRAAASRHRRSPRFSMAVRPIVAATEDAAWERARHVGELRQANTRDGRPWPPLTRGPDANAGPAPLVGSYAQVTEALLGYVALGVSVLVIYGDDPEADAADWAAIIRLTRERAGNGGCLVA